MTKDILSNPMHMKRRLATQKRLMIASWGAVIFALSVLVCLLGQVVLKAWPALRQTEIALEVISAPDADPEQTLKQALAATFPEVTERAAKRRLYQLVTLDAVARVREIAPDAQPVRVWVPARTISTQSNADQQAWMAKLTADGRVRTVFNSRFFTAADSRDPDRAGILGALVGSIMTMLVCLGLALPLGVAAAIYLQELAPRHRLTDMIDISINNLAAVPSIVFGLLGLVVFLQLGGLPRSAPIVGGMTLAMMTLPTIIIAARAALASVPPSIRQAAQGLGASPIQVIFHHVLPLALPGVMTGSVLGMARALGETAPLMMIGMVAFIADVPARVTDSATVLPVQIYLWADHPDPAFAARTAAAILVLLVMLLVMNGAALFLRQKYQKRF